MHYYDNNLYTTHIWFIRDTYLAPPRCYRTYQVLGQEEFRPCRYGLQDGWVRARRAEVFS